MALGPEAVTLALMALFGVGTAVFLAYMLRDLIARFAAGPDGEVAPAATVASARRIALVGPVLYLVGFLVVLAGTLLDPGPLAGVDPVDLGLAIILVAAVPMAVGLHRVWRAS